MSRRVVITGIGLVSSVGNRDGDLLAEPRRGAQRRGPHHPVRPHGLRRADRRARSRGSTRSSSSRRRKSRRSTSSSSTRSRRRSSRWMTPGSGSTPENADRVGVFIASGIGGFATIEREHSKLLEGGPGRISPFFIPASIINLAAGHVSIRFGAKGPNLATCTACSASAHALGEACEIIRRGDADAMIAGGSEAAITPMGVGGFAAMRALSTRNDEPEKASRPFDAERDGFVIGEGSGVLVLEELELRARARRPDLRRDRRLRRLGRRLPHHRARARTATAPCAPCRRRSSAESTRRRRRLHQRARHVDAAQRPDRDAGDQAVLRRPRAQAWPSPRPSR